MLTLLMIGPDKTAKGGIATVINNFLQNPEFKVRTLTTWNESNWLSCFFMSLISIRFIIKKHTIDLVHFHVAQDGSFWRKSLLLLLVPKNVPSIFHMHASQFDKFYENANRLQRYWIKRTFQRCDRVIAVSLEWKLFYGEITDTTVLYIENSVPVSKRTCFCPNNKRIITLGKIGKRKGTYDIIKIADIIWQQDKEIVFDVYGNGELEKFQKIAREMPNVNVHSWITHEEMLQTLSGTSIHLLPSYHEGLPMAVLETMALGIPNITSTVGGLPSLITHGQNGWLVTAGESKKIADLILEVVQNKDLADVSVAAKATIEARFSITNYFVFWKNLYGELLN